MLHGSLLAKLNAIAKHVKGSPRPFGGIQLVFTGDFFQLPPVGKKRGGGGGGSEHDYAFLHPVWCVPCNLCWFLRSKEEEEDGEEDVAPRRYIALMT